MDSSSGVLCLLFTFWAIELHALRMTGVFHENDSQRSRK